jgi:hypothetical protein
MYSQNTYLPFTNTSFKLHSIDKEERIVSLSFTPSMSSPLNITFMTMTTSQDRRVARDIACLTFPSSACNEDSHFQ